VTTNLEIKRFRREDYPEYAAWFVDPELNRHLGPMDLTWLEAVLSQPDAAGATWSVFRETELVAIIETVFDMEHRLPAVIAAFATKPELRRQGIGTQVLQQILLMHRSKGINEHVAYVSIHNPGARRSSRLLLLWNQSSRSPGSRLCRALRSKL
jgi:GNAT superfamily N-acetyltransferase